MRVQKGSAIHHVIIRTKMWCCVDMVSGRNRSIREFGTPSCFSKLKLVFSVTPLRGVLQTPNAINRQY
jgi:hypothetical protein